MNMETHSFMDGKLHVYKRDSSRFWQCSTYIDGRNHRVSTKEDKLSLAREFAREWYMAVYLDSKHRKQVGRTERVLQKLGYKDEMPLLPAKSTSSKNKKSSGPTFQEAAEKFMREYKIITAGQRNERYVKGHDMRINVHLLPFFGDLPVSAINAGIVQEYRTQRHTNGYKGIIPSRATLHHETVTLRLVLKTAHRYGWIEAVPDISPPYKASGKISHRAWFSPEEYKMLYEATRERAKNPKKERWRGVCEDFHDYVLFMGNTGLRPDESARLEMRDVSIIDDDATGKRILEIEVRGKRGVGYCKSMPGAVVPFERMCKRHNLKPTDRIFGKPTRELMNSVLSELNLKYDRDGNMRTNYSLRHTYICMRLMEGADIYQVAKNCRTSVEMIEKFYAVHLKNTLDTSAINVRKSKKLPKKAKKMTQKNN